MPDERQVPQVCPGYVGFSKSDGFMGRAIRFGEMISGGRGEVNHMFIVDKVDGDRCTTIQAQIKGVTRGELLDGEYLILQPPRGVSLNRVLAFARKQVGLEYGIFTILAIAIDIITWQWVPSFRGARKPSWICSALGAECLRFGGWLHAGWIDIYTVTPQQVLDALLKEGWEVVADTINP